MVVSQRSREIGKKDELSKSADRRALRLTSPEYPFVEIRLRICRQGALGRDERLESDKVIRMTRPHRSISVLNRREVLGSLLAASALASGEDLVTIPEKRPMLVHNDRPEDLETPLSYFDSWLTPNDAFFVRQHLPRPAKIEGASFRLTLKGRVSKQIVLTLADLQKLSQHTVPAVLECTGNGRGFFRPRVPGIQWERGAVGNAEWSGPALSDVLKLAGADADASCVTVNGADIGVAKTPDFIRSLPMKKALHPSTLLALKMNGQPLPDLHGFPLRLVVPGWDGTSWVKWVDSVSVANEPDKGFYMAPAYRFPKHALLPGTPANPADLEVIESMPVKSYITGPVNGAEIQVGRTTVRGMAWAGEERIAKVDISTDGGSRWDSAELSSHDLPYTWRLWTFAWTPEKPGYHTILSRATDSAGRVQPIVATWNPSGYLYNAIDQIGIMVADGK
jgi:DMSO/TMAO reductase YedYZ molybdopterin-dependent catalytic subunit